MKIEFTIPDELLPRWSAMTRFVHSDVIGEWIVRALPSSKPVMDERNRLIWHHANRLGIGDLWSGCGFLAGCVKARDPSVADLLGLGCN